MNNRSFKFGIGIGVRPHRGSDPYWFYWLALLLLLPLAAPAFSGATGNGNDPLPKQTLNADYILLGEVHDNTAGLALRFSWLQKLTAQRKVSIALEQLDASNQVALDSAITGWKSAHQNPDANQAHSIAEAAQFDFKGWKWPLYEPVFTLVLAQNIPLAAANLSRSELGHIMSGERSAPDEPIAWNNEQRETLLNEVRVGHCNLMPEHLLPSMVNAQRARDYEMAQTLVALHQRTHGPVVLLAGNGHLRNDLAVPVWLHQMDPHAVVVSVAVLESESQSSEQALPTVANNHDKEPVNAFDVVAYVPEEPRPDPCEALRQRLHK